MRISAAVAAAFLLNFSRLQQPTTTTGLSFPAAAGMKGFCLFLLLCLRVVAAAAWELVREPRERKLLL